MIKCYIIEEHNEAFFVWMNSYRNGLILPDSTLLHFDDHSDFRAPVLKDSLREIINSDPKKIKRFSYEQLTIDTFITPSIFLGLFHDFYWIKHDMPSETCKKMLIRSYNSKGKKLMIEQDHIEGIAVREEDSKSFFYHKIKASELGNHEMRIKNDVVLDIDLDYFSCCENPFVENEIIIEISKNEYENFIKNKEYHYLNYVTANVHVKAFDNSYFYILNYIPEVYPSKRKVSKDIIDSRIGDLINFLKEKAVSPKLITICRSRISGFTPKDQWQYIESKLINELGRTYDLDLVCEGKKNAVNM